MKQKEGSALETLRRVQGFLDTHADVFASVNQSSTRRNLDNAVTQLTAHAADQETGLRSSKGETARQRALRLALRIHEMIPIVEAAKNAKKTVPELKALTMPDSHVRVEELLAAAGAMAETAGKHQQVLIDAGLPDNFVARLTAAADAVRQSIDVRGQNLGRRAGGTSGLGSEEKRARSLIKMVQGRVLPIVGGDAKMLAEWRSAKRINRKPGPVVGSEQAAAAVATATTPETPKAA
jgi:nucleotide-binding universal stress UspA family protein